MINIMRMEDETTWPAEVIDYLDIHHDLFLNWTLGATDRVGAREYDRAIYGLRDVLRVEVDYALHGYHCTRLTDFEIEHVLARGMQMPDQAMLNARIDAVEQAELIDAQISAYLKGKNQAHETYRAGMLWFCFFPPHLAGQSGIERFFRSWGGEALYNSHERDTVSGPILNRIGIPCVVEAYVPLASLEEHGGSDFKVIQNYLVNRGLVTVEPLEHEDRTKRALAPESIARIIKYPAAEFIRLTKCDEWRPLLG